MTTESLPSHSNTRHDMSNQENIRENYDDETTSLLESSSAGDMSYFMGLFQIASKTSNLNILSYLLAALINICLFVFINSSQGFVLTQILFVPSAEIGNAVGTLTFADELLSVFALWIWGLASDKVF